jgi:hypothetical protein
MCVFGRPSQSRSGLDRSAAAHNPGAFLRAIVRTAPMQNRFAEQHSSVRLTPPVAEAQAATLAAVWLGPVLTVSCLEVMPTRLV